jgi:transcriptional regulator with XRE-family HTH domain
MAERLGCSQQAVARVERPDSNPTVSFLKEWAAAVGREVEISLGQR